LTGLRVAAMLVGMDRCEPIDLGPGTLLWRWAGDNRLSFTGLSAGILQLMHPGLGAGVVEHSAFFTEPWDRIIRSLPEIIGVVYDGPEAEVTGHRVRDYHRRIKGVDHLGRRYSALSPETFWWAHATPTGCPGPNVSSSTARVWSGTAVTASACARCPRTAPRGATRGTSTAPRCSR
jgi:uncharacterized protein (DUF2236 family)